MTAAPPRLQHFVGGAFRASAGDRWIASINPSDSADVVAHLPEGVADDVHAAVDAASDALERWRELTGAARAEFLYRWATAIGERQEPLAQLVSREVGKPIGEARGEVGRCVMILRY
ncbi:MAG: Aldehyde Dehydrogenase, partial [Gemmatimonadetes bacterium]|nr:Aldehyde Dehydrogenase [Gemmatimonadota bacterium]